MTRRVSLEDAGAVRVRLETRRWTRTATPWLAVLMLTLDLKTAATFTHAMLKALGDSTEIEALLTGEEISSVGRMLALVPLLEADPEGRAILRERPHLDAQSFDGAALRALPAGTLGHEYMAHLDREGLDPMALTTPATRGVSPLANYMLERVRQTHDIWHTMLGLGAAGHEEVLVHAFQWPQLRMPYSALVVGFGTPKHLVGEGRWETLTRKLPRAVRAGRLARPLIAVYWERHWETPLDTMRERLRVSPAAAW